MTRGDRATAQLQTFGWLHTFLAELDIEYWLFGGWTVDFHAGRVTRDHEDVDLAVWQSDLDHIRALLKGARVGPRPRAG
jgi:hypothetical protein